MFHTNQYGPSEIYVRNTSESHEHRAPTDDSIRIYDELRRKAEDSILARGTVDVAGFKVEFAALYTTPFGGFRLRFRFRLGGVDYDEDVEVGTDEVYFTPYDGPMEAHVVNTLAGKARDAIVKSVAKAVSVQVLLSAKGIEDLKKWCKG